MPMFNIFLCDSYSRLMENETFLKRMILQGSCMQELPETWALR